MPRYNREKPKICVGESCRFWLAEHSCVGCHLRTATIDAPPQYGTLPLAKLVKGQFFISYGGKVKELDETITTSQFVRLGDKYLEIEYTFTAVKKSHSAYWSAEEGTAWLCEINEVKIIDHAIEERIAEKVARFLTTDELVALTYALIDNSSKDSIRTREHLGSLLLNLEP